MQRSRGLTLEEITRILEEDDEDVSAIYIEPPEATIYSDEDSVDEDSGGLIDNLSSRQLRAGAETVLTDGRRSGGCDSDEDDAKARWLLVQVGGQERTTAAALKAMGKVAAKGKPTAAPDKLDKLCKVNKADRPVVYDSKKSTKLRWVIARQVSFVNLSHVDDST
ncbi:hypothetical protein HPB50_008912 [Hyalomma asiaticum]|uniref:Uncharacterized protein n=1 Tax=Hyalomma asiaticum TaxID=266040 RepID=A0ACB7SCN8_HYAAI|nr:hypothetical protein HPB50_008912 [Hyalomma asiaticum]